MSFEEEYQDVLQNIEAAIVNTYRVRRDLSDYEVMRAVEVLVDDYSGEKIERSPRSVNLSDLERRLVNGMRSVCEWRLGREPGPFKEIGIIEPITIDEVILCLKRIAKSAKMWNKEGGSQGYLTFVSQFM